jgi:membrane protein
MNAVHRWLLRFKPYFLFIEWTKVLILPGFKPLPLYTVAGFFFKELGKESLVNKASSLAYTFMLAIFPGIIFLFTLIPYIPIPDFQNQLLSLMQLVLPKNAFLAVQTTLEDIVRNQNAKLLSFGFFFALFFATNGVHKLMIAFNKASLVNENRSWWKQRMVATILTFMIVFALIFGLGIITFGEYIAGLLRTKLGINRYFLILVVELARWTTLTVLYFITISMVYKYGPATRKKWKFFRVNLQICNNVSNANSYHFDNTDNIIKFHIYLSEVDTNDKGALVYIENTHITKRLMLSSPVKYRLELNGENSSGSILQS